MQNYGSSKINLRIPKKRINHPPSKQVISKSDFQLFHAIFARAKFVIIFKKDRKEYLTRKMKKVDPRVKDILILLGAGTFLATSLVMPGLPIVLKPYLDRKRKNEEKEWEKFNLFRLRQVIKRLEKQKDVEIIGDEVKITKRGRQKLLKFDLEQMELKRKTDGKWRLIIYDISNLRKPQRELFRDMLKKLQFLRLQESVYPAPQCPDRKVVGAGFT